MKTSHHYVYRITNTKLNKHYYGSRTCRDILPKDDLGIKYFSSSTDKDFRKDQQLNPHHYKYKIIKEFDNKKEAIQLEINLHEKFDVGMNPQFYNKAKQTSSGFDNTGTIAIKNLKTNKIKRHPKDEDIEEGWVVYSNLKDTTTVINVKTNKRITVTLDEYHNNDDLVSIKKGFITCVDKNTNQKHQVSKEEFYKRDDLVTISSNKVCVKDKDGNTFQVSKEEFYKRDDLVSVNLYRKHTKEAKLKMSKPGHKNANAKRINIYNDKDELIFESHGNLLKTCEEENLSYYLILHSSKSKTVINSKTNVNKHMLGWYAINIDDDLFCNLKDKPIPIIPKKKLRYHIYDDKNNLIYKVYDGLSRYCRENNLPHAFCANIGKPIYLNLDKSNITRAIKRGFYKYKGWRVERI